MNEAVDKVRREEQIAQRFAQEDKICMAQES